MVTFGFNQQKCKTQCQLCAGRIKLMRNKRSVKLRGLRKDVGDLLRAGKTDLAQIRIEGVMRDEAIMHAYEVVELYVETVKLRVAVIDRSREIPEDMLQAITTLIYASQRLDDLPELDNIKSLLTSKYGRDYAKEAADTSSAHKWKVHPEVERWLSIDPPTPNEKRTSLKDIAQEYKIVWDTDEADQQLRSYLLGPSAADAGRTRPGAPFSAGQQSYDSGGNRDRNPGHYNHNAASASTIHGAEVPLQPPPIGSYQRSIQQSPLRDSSRPSSLLQLQQQQLRQFQQQQRQDQQQSQRSERQEGGEHSQQRSRGPFDPVERADDGPSSPSVYFYSPEQQAKERRRQRGRSCSSSSSSDGVVEYPQAGDEEDGVVKYPKAGAPSDRHTLEGLDDMDANDTKSPADNYHTSQYRGTSSKVPMTATETDTNTQDSVESDLMARLAALKRS